MQDIVLRIVSDASYDLSTVDMSPQAIKILAANPDVIFVIAASGDAANLFAQPSRRDIKGTMSANLNR